MHATWRSAVASIVAAIASAGGQAQERQAPVFSSAVNAVSVYATVRDAEGRLAPYLTLDDFEVRVGGRPQEIVAFSADSQPITACLLLDMSGSVMRRLLRLRDSSLQFIKALTPVDRARIGTFGAEIFISPLLTSDQKVLERVLREELWPGGMTPLWGALGAALDSLANEPGRRVVLIFTDGAAAGTLPGYPATYSSVASRVVDGGLMLYSIGIRNDTLAESVDPDLMDLVLRSGGGRFDLRDDADLEETFTRVADELRRQYLIGFRPDANLKGRQRIDLRVKRGGYRVQARREFTVEERR